LIGAAQKAEHYEIAGYTTARNLAQQLKMTRAYPAPAEDPCQGGKCRPAPQSGGPTTDVGGQDAFGRGGLRQRKSGGGQ